MVARTGGAWLWSRLVNRSRFVGICNPTLHVVRRGRDPDDNATHPPAHPGGLSLRNSKANSPRTGCYHFATQLPGTGREGEGHAVPIEEKGPINRDFLVRYETRTYTVSRITKPLLYRSKSPAHLPAPFPTTKRPLAALAIVLSSDGGINPAKL
jgi:hypothetical protein